MCLRGHRSSFNHPITSTIDLAYSEGRKLLLSLGCWLILARRFCVYNAGVKVNAALEILTVIMMSNDENVRSCKRDTVVRSAFCFFGDHFALSWPRDSLP